MFSIILWKNYIETLESYDYQVISQIWFETMFKIYFYESMTLCFWICVLDQEFQHKIYDIVWALSHNKYDYEIKNFNEGFWYYFR